MPFTPAHTIAVLPFLKSRQLSATALIIGSMAPDFEYFFRMGMQSDWGHTTAGIFYFDLTVTIFLAFIFHRVVKPNLVAALPRFAQQKMRPMLVLTVNDVFRRPLLFALSAVIGAATHLIWDGFTHSNGFFVNALPGLYKEAHLLFEGVKYPMWYALQNISTYVGLTIQLIYLLMMPRGSAATTRPNWWYWPLLTTIAILTVAFRFRFDVSTARFGHLVIVLISGICIGLVLLGFVPFRREIDAGS